jgi:hypothetical protein
MPRLYSIQNGNVTNALKKVLVNIFESDFIISPNSSVISQELSDNIMTMLTNASAVLSKVRQQPPTPGVGVVGTKGPSLAPGPPPLSALQNPVTNPVSNFYNFSKIFPVGIVIYCM